MQIQNWWLSILSPRGWGQLKYIYCRKRCEQNIWMTLKTLWMFACSSIVDVVIRIISKQFIHFFFFYEKISRVEKLKSNQNQPIFFLLQVFIGKKWLHLLFFVRIVLFCWLVLLWFAFLYPQNLFVKKHKLVWNCPNNLTYYTYWRLPYY